MNSELQPDPALLPQQVITIQLAALQHNDEPEPDAGIRTAFRFASPANRALTGPIDRFIALVKDEIYRPMLGFQAVQRGPVIANEEQAYQRVELTAADGSKAVYVFGLSRQTDPPYVGCWMTDSVVRVPYIDPRLN
jgi:hypothetical protein